jgi:hypothetical protein
VGCSSNLNSSHELQKARRDATCAGKHLETSWKYHSLSTSALQDVSKSVVYRISVQQGFNKQSARHAPTPSPQCMQPHAIVLDVLDLIAKYRDVEHGSEHRHGCFGEVARLAAAPTSSHSRLHHAVCFSFTTQPRRSPGTAFGSMTVSSIDKARFS